MNKYSNEELTMKTRKQAEEAWKALNGLKYYLKYVEEGIKETSDLINEIEIMQSKVFDLTYAFEIE